MVSLYLCTFVALVSSITATTVPLRLVSYNIRYATTSPGSGEQPWSTRRPKLFSQLNFETANRPDALLCFQEVLYRQLLDIQTDLGTTWSHIGVGRDDGRTAGEFSPIFYQPSAWTLRQNKTHWLSPTPNVPSKGWDAALNRIVTAAQFKHVDTGVEVVLLCTHFDHEGQTARENSAKLIVNITKEIESETNQKRFVFLGGDLNSQPNNAAYRTLVATNALKDVREMTPTARRYGNTKTYTAFTTSTGDDTQLDYLFVRDGTNVTFNAYGVLANRFDDDGFFISDHRPVVADVQLAIS